MSLKTKKRTPVIFRYPNAKGLFIKGLDFTPGGAPLQVATLAKHLAEDSCYDVMLWVDGPVPKEPIDGVRLISLTPPISKGVPLISRFINKYRKEYIYKKNSQGVFVFTVIDQYFFPEQKKEIQKFGGKILYMLASDLDVEPEARGSGGQDAFTRAMLDSDLLIAQTEYQQDVLAKRYQVQSIVIPSRWFGKRETKKGEDFVLWVGQGWAVKRPWIVLELALEFPEEQFLMIMPKVDELLDKIIRIDAERIPNLRILDFVNPAEIQDYFNRAKLVINTSTHEGFPNTLLQAAAGASPYVSLSWNPNCYLEEHQIGAGSKNDMEKMVANIKKYLSDENLRRKIGAHAQSYLKTVHNDEMIISQWKDAVSYLVNKERTKA